MKKRYQISRELLRGRFARVRRRLRGTKPGLVQQEKLLKPGLAVQVWPPQSSALTDAHPASKAATVPAKPTPSPHKKVGVGHSIVQFLLTLVMIVSFTIAGLVFVPSVYYAFVEPTVVPVIPERQKSTLGGEFTAGPVASAAAYRPPIDQTLPTGNWLSIPRIGVRTQLLDTKQPDEALAKGVWWVPDFGKPGDTDVPMILAAHRYGWQWWWKSDYWKYHSFYLLPELKPGDTVEIIADQRKWIYEIYAGEEGDEITDYGADLILYTCKFLNSPVRHFRYARLVDPTKNSQSGS